jgi:hypothetical protein
VTDGRSDAGKSVIAKKIPPKAVRKNIQGSLRRISNIIPGFSDNGSSSHALLFGWKLEDNTACNSGRTLSLNPQPILRVVDSCENSGLVASDDATSFGGLIDIKEVRSLATNCWTSHSMIAMRLESNTFYACH